MGQGKFLKKQVASDFKDFNSPEKKSLYLNSVLDIK